MSSDLRYGPGWKILLIVWLRMASPILSHSIIFYLDPLYNYTLDKAQIETLNETF